MHRRARLADGPSFFVLAVRRRGEDCRAARRAALSPPAAPWCRGFRNRLSAGNAVHYALHRREPREACRDELLHHRVRALGLRAGGVDPQVLAALEHLEPALAARGAVGGGELLLERG